MGINRFNKKLNPDGFIDKYKVRLVTKGFKQKDNLNYFDDVSYNLEIHQMNAKTAFLNGDLKEEIYMEQREGFVILRYENKVCKLVKSLDGLKQAPKQYHQKFDSIIISNGFNICDSKKCAYWKSADKSFILMCLICGWYSHFLE